MPRTLTGAKADFEQVLYVGLFQAAQQAFMTAFKVDAGGDKDADPMITSHVGESMNTASIEFADKFATLSSKSISDAVYNYVREIGITMIPKGTLLSASPGSPVTGTAQINDFVIT